MNLGLFIYLFANLFIIYLFIHRYAMRAEPMTFSSMTIKSRKKQKEDNLTFLVKVVLSKKR